MFKHAPLFVLPSAAEWSIFCPTDVILKSWCLIYPMNCNWREFRTLAVHPYPRQRQLHQSMSRNNERVQKRSQWPLGSRHQSTLQCAWGGCWELNSRPLKEQQALSTTDPSLQSLGWCFFHPCKTATYKTAQFVSLPFLLFLVKFQFQIPNFMVKVLLYNLPYRLSFHAVISIWN